MEKGSLNIDSRWDRIGLVLMKMMTEQIFIQQGDLSHILSLSWHDVHKISSCGPNTWPIHGGTNIIYVLRFLAYTSFSS